MQRHSTLARSLPLARQPRSKTLTRKDAHALAVARTLIEGLTLAARRVGHCLALVEHTCPPARHEVGFRSLGFNSLPRCTSRAHEWFGSSIARAPCANRLLI